MRRPIRRQGSCFVAIKLSIVRTHSDSAVAATCLLSNMGLSSRFFWASGRPGLVVCRLGASVCCVMPPCSGRFAPTVGTVLPFCLAGIFIPSPMLARQ